MIRALERRPPDVSYKQLVDVYAADTAARDPEMLQATLLPHLVKRSQVQGSFADFKRRFDECTGGLADRLRSVPGVAFAGGSVTAGIVDCGYSDIDIFLVCGLSRAREILELIYAALAEMVQERHGSKEGRLLVTRSKHAITTVEETSSHLTVRAAPAYGGFHRQVLPGARRSRWAPTDPGHFDMLRLRGGFA